MKSFFVSLLAPLALFLAPGSVALPAGASSESHDGGGGLLHSLAPIPLGSPDGAYAGRLDPNGTTIWEFVGGSDVLQQTQNLNMMNLNLAQTSESESVDSAETLARHPRGINCEKHVLIDGEDRWEATFALAGICGAGAHFDNKALAVQHGNVVAYGCNYGVQGQTCHSWDLQSFFDTMAGYCGENKAAFWHKRKWRASWGYTSLGRGFC
ncbi:hypothetical protein QBC44DRAFT_358322 [Cladorrhinum sp. PSN332]|nr:hypothetical protein QBC44DRAFT_358322 [Cladorrhinum sp. PSN332]